MKNNATPVMRAQKPAPKPSAHSSGPLRPAMRRQHTSTTLRSVSDGVQLRPDQVFLYQRPSKASYYRPEPTYGREQEAQMHAPAPVLARPRRVSSLGSTTSRSLQAGATSEQHRSADRPNSSRPASIRSVSSSRPQTPCQMMGVQPDYPPSPAFSATTSIYPLETVRTHQRRASQGAHSAHGDSGPGLTVLAIPNAALATAEAHAPVPQDACSRRLARQETQMSAYSQQTYCEDYGRAMDRCLSTASSTGKHITGGTSRPVHQYHGGTDTAFTPGVAFESNARLWQELEQALLGENLRQSPPAEETSVKQSSPTLGTECEGSVYDFAGDAREDTACARRGKTDDDRPLRPCLARRKSSHYRYKGHERHGRSIVNSALAATTPFLLPANSFDGSPMHSPTPHLPTASASSSSQHTGDLTPVALHKHDCNAGNLIQLRSGLRAKTPGNETFEDQALHELRRQSAPSEADHDGSGQDLSDEGNSEDCSGKEVSVGVANRVTERERLKEHEQHAHELAGRESPIVQAGDAKGTIARSSGDLESNGDVECGTGALKAIPRVSTKTVRRSTRIPAPKARPFAGKLYAERGQKRDVV